MIKYGGINMNINSKKVVSSLLVASMIALGTGFLNIDNNKAEAAQQMQPLQGKIVYIPTGTTIPVTATMELSSETLALGQNVCAAISNAFYYNNTLIAPIGSTVNGTVIQVKKAGHAGVNGQLLIKFTNIVTPYGQMIPISGKIQTDDGTGIIKGGTKKDSATAYAKDVAVGAGAGAVMGVIMGPLSGGKVGKGAAYGTAVGAGAGLAKSLWDKGIPASIPAGSIVNIRLDQQATVSPMQSYRY